MSHQTTLFDELDQIKNMDRVKSKLTKPIFDFCKEHKYFKMSELAAHCMKERNCSPDSPSRIFREMKRMGVLNYVVISRANSFYKVYI